MEEQERNKILCISNIDIFKNISSKAKEKIAPVATFKDYSAGQTIFTPYETEEKIYLVEKGGVEVYQLSTDGKKVIIDKVTPGGIFGNISLAPNLKTKVTDFAEATEDTCLCEINKSDFLKILQEIPEVAMNVIIDLSNKLNEAESRIRDLALGNVSVRLMNELLRLSRKQGTETKERIRINNRYTHEELAELIGASRETVTRALGELKQKKFIEIDRKRRIIVNKEKIEEIL
jgi:CRP/FNR family transcriptional regulator